LVFASGKAIPKDITIFSNEYFPLFLYVGNLLFPAVVLPPL
jgi:hypothetical protein